MKTIHFNMTLEGTGKETMTFQVYHSSGVVCTRILAVELVQTREIHFSLEAEKEITVEIQKAPKLLVFPLIRICDDISPLSDRQLDLSTFI